MWRGCGEGGACSGNKQKHCRKGESAARRLHQRMSERPNPTWKVLAFTMASAAGKRGSINLCEVANLGSVRARIQHRNYSYVHGLP